MYRLGDTGVEVVICGRTSPSIWGLPKGTPERGETREETALREVSEETGLATNIEEYIGSVEYSFSRPKDRLRRRKTVHYYLMNSTGGDVSLHDHEFDCVLWLPAEDAVRVLTYQNEVGIVQEALSVVAKKSRTG